MDLDYNVLKYSIIPNESDIEFIYKNITELPKDNMIEIIVNYLQNMKSPIHNITNNGTVFELNDFNFNIDEHKNIFWNIFNYIKLYKDNTDRKELINVLEKENDEIFKKLNNKLN